MKVREKHVPEKRYCKACSHIGFVSSEGGDDEDYSNDDGSTLPILFTSYYCTKTAVPYKSSSLSRGRMCLWKEHTRNNFHSSSQLTRDECYIHIGR